MFSRMTTAQREKKAPTAGEMKKFSDIYGETIANQILPPGID